MITIKENIEALEARLTFVAARMNEALEVHDEADFHLYCEQFHCLLGRITNLEEQL